jgi:hypothetical protein
VEGVGISEAVNFYQAAWCNIPADKFVPLTVSSYNMTVL